MFKSKRKGMLTQTTRRKVFDAHQAVVLSSGPIVSRRPPPTCDPYHRSLETNKAIYHRQVSTLIAAGRAEPSHWRCLGFTPAVCFMKRPQRVQEAARGAGHFIQSPLLWDVVGSSMALLLYTFTKVVSLSLLLMENPPNIPLLALS